MPQNFDLTQTGPELQERIDQVFPNRDNITAEGERAQGAEQELDAVKATRQELQAETTRAQAAEQSLHDYTDAETTRAQAAEQTLSETLSAEVSRAQAAEHELESSKATREELQAENSRATTKEADLQAQIDAIVSKDATVNLTASPTTIFVGTATNIALTATTNTDATAINIKRGTTTLATGSGKTLSHTDAAVTLNAPGSVAYSADFTISGLHRSTNKSVTAVYPIFYGAQAEFDAESLTQYATPTTSVARAYTVQLDSTRRKFYLRVPKQGVAQVKSVVMGSGSEASPVSGGIVAALSDENYNVWASDDGFTGNGPQVFTVS